MTDLSDRTMVLERVIGAPVALVWGAWMNPETLPQWWGPEGYTCRTTRIDLRAGGEWVFDMIGPDGKVWPNHHRYGLVEPLKRIEYTLHWGDNGPKHADAWAEFVDQGDRTQGDPVHGLRDGRGIRGCQGLRRGGTGLADLGQARAFHRGRVTARPEGSKFPEQRFWVSVPAILCLTGIRAPCIGCGSGPSSSAPRPRPFPISCAR